jgi:hypothetical protein
VSYIADVVTGTAITATWGNAIRNQVISTHASVAARTSAVPSPPNGMFSYLQDVDRLDVYNNTAWVPAAAQLIGPPVVLGAPAATVTFSSIPQTFGSLLLMGLGQSSNANFNNDNTIIFNSDTGANYSMATWDTNQVNANTFIGSFSSGDTSLKWAFSFPGTSFNANRAGGFMVHIPGYANTSLSKVSLHDNWLTDGGTSFTVHKRFGFWKSTSAISTILLTNSGGNFTAGSYFALYGLP